jgi:hypothetical protein
MTYVQLSLRSFNVIASLSPYFFRITTNKHLLHCSQLFQGPLPTYDVFVPTLLILKLLFILHTTAMMDGKVMLYDESGDTGGSLCNLF